MESPIELTKVSDQHQYRMTPTESSGKYYVQKLARNGSWLPISDLRPGAPRDCHDYDDFGAYDAVVTSEEEALDAIRAYEIAVSEIAAKAITLPDDIVKNQKYQYRLRPKKNGKFQVEYYDYEQWNAVPDHRWWKILEVDSDSGQCAKAVVLSVFGAQHVIKAFEKHLQTL